MTTPTCNLCGAAGAAPFCTAWRSASGETYRFLACRSCGLLWVDPLPRAGPAALADLNERTFYSETRAALFPPYLKSQDELARALESYVAPGRLLDLGCGAGHFLRAAARRGWRAVGVDVAAAPPRPDDAGRIEVHRARLEDVGFEPASFDAVNLSHVLEHLPDPRAALEDARRLLRPGGLLAIGVPNPRSAVHWVRNASYALAGRLGRDRYSADLCPPQHLYAFPPRTLERALGRLGFRVRRSFTAPLGDARLAAPFQLRYSGPSLRRGLELAVDAAARPLGRCSLTFVYALKER